MNIKTTEPYIEKWASNLTDRIVEIRYFDVAEIKTNLKLHLAMGMAECLSVQISELDKEIDVLKVEIYNYTGKKRIEMQNRLCTLKSERHEKNTLLTNAKFIRDRHENLRSMYEAIFQEYGKDELNRLKQIATNLKQQ